MARKQEYPSNAEMLDYLYSKGISYSPRSQNPVERQKYLNRLYRGAKKHEGENLTPKEVRKRARGHTPRTEHIAKKGKVSDQYKVKGTKKKPLQAADLSDLLNKANPGGRRPGPMSGSITGLIKYQNPVTGMEELVEKTYSFRVDRADYEAQLAKHGDNILEFARAISGYPWEVVYSINLKSY